MTPEKIDIVIVGAGPAGLAAAAVLAQNGANVVVLDEAPIPGGRLPGQIHPQPGRKPGSLKKWSNGAARACALTEMATQAGARIICGASVWGIFSGWHVAVAPVDPNSSHADLPAGYDARAVIIATGATQNPVVLDGWTLPGVITAGAAQTLINIHHVLPGRNAAFVGLDPLSMSTAQLMSEAGANVHGIVLPPVNGLQTELSSPAAAIKTLARFSNYAPRRSLALLGKISGRMSRIAAILYPKSGVAVDGTRLFLRHAALAVEGRSHAEQIVVAGVNSDGMIKSDRKKRWKVDVVITSAGLSPLVELAQVSGCPLIHVSDLGGWVPLHNLRLETPLDGLFVSGSITGVEGSEVAEAQGRLAGLVVSDYLGLLISTSVNDSLIECQIAVHAARKKAISFLPNIVSGRDELLRHWEVNRVPI
ncbi:MAG: FAD-dependent oxidoreductase [Deltaproteobacteria bacterium]|nr:FAD-dependent oxidoreductase [Deltaproteobacteria bacterium]